MEKNPLIPAKAGTQADLKATGGRMGPRLRGDERWMGALAALLATPALAHPGHHETISLADQARHLLTQPDHILAFAGLVVLAVIGTWHWRRAKARK